MVIDMSNPSSIKKFKKEYMRYYNREIKKAELLKNFNINENTFIKWREKLNLPVFDNQYAYTIEIPKNFREIYMDFYNNNLSKKELLKICNASEPTVCRWRNKFELPWVKGAFQSLLEPNKWKTKNSMLQSIKDYIFTFNIFGYKLQIQSPFKIEKVEQSTSINVSCNFNDFVEY